MFKRKKTCNFCGREVCIDCSNRTFPNPKNSEEFVTICDGCHAQYLYKLIIDSYVQKKKKREDTHRKFIEKNI